LPVIAVRRAAGSAWLDLFCVIFGLECHAGCVQPRACRTATCADATWLLLCAAGAGHCCQPVSPSLAGFVISLLLEHRSPPSPFALQEVRRCANHGIEFSPAC
jgi:hypothetical protein